MEVAILLQCKLWKKYAALDEDHQKIVRDAIPQKYFSRNLEDK